MKEIVIFVLLISLVYAANQTVSNVPGTCPSADKGFCINNLISCLSIYKGNEVKSCSCQKNYFTCLLGRCKDGQFLGNISRICNTYNDGPNCNGFNKTINCNIAGNVAPIWMLIVFGGYLLFG